MEAESLLRWFDAAWALDGYRPARRVLAALATLERARVAWGEQQAALARDQYRTFLRRYDLPVPAHQPLIAEAQATMLNAEG